MARAGGHQHNIRGPQPRSHCRRQPNNPSCLVATQSPGFAGASEMPRALRSTGPPGSTSRCSLKACRLASREGWRRWRIARPMACGDVCVAYGSVPNGKLACSVEHHAPAAGVTPLEAEHELTEVVVQVRVFDGTLVCTENPPLGQRGDSVHGGQQLRSLLIAAAPASALTARFMGARRATSQSSSSDSTAGKTSRRCSDRWSRQRQEERLRRTGVPLGSLKLVANQVPARPSAGDAWPIRSDRKRRPACASDSAQRFRPCRWRRASRR